MDEEGLGGGEVVVNVEGKELCEKCDGEKGGNDGDESDNSNFEQEYSTMMRMIGDDGG